MSSTSPQQADCEYIVVGSGAGGGTVASRLALAGRSVILLEAGGDPRKLKGGDPIQPDVNRLPADYDVPAFHAFASENNAVKWDFYVRHYSDDDQQKRDWKYVKERDGVLYPRAGTLGGCTAHNAQILVYPHNSDWEYIADLTHDESWRANRMRTYFERMEDCRHRPLQRLLAKFGLNPSRHGWKGWLRTEKAIPMRELFKKDLFHALADCIKDSLRQEGHLVERLGWFLESWGDPNDWRLVEKDAIGSRYLPLTTRNHARTGTREFILDTARKRRNLRVELNALATKVLFDKNMRAIGVEYLRGENQYRACSQPTEETGETRRIYASKEVILAGGAFNTPQLLMLSGIGAREELEAFDIEVLVDLPGVGKNLQDRYEIAVGNRISRSQWELYDRIKFSTDDPQFQQWSLCRTGIYGTNGSVLSFFKRSPVAEGPPDLFCMALLANFQGYFPGYSSLFAKDLNYLTWVVLKAHSRNTMGTVSLRSPDPRDTPHINFRYFGEGGEKDMDAVLDGIRFVRKLSAGLEHDKSMSEVFPGEDEELKAFVRNNAWGHHASCTCAIGPREQGGVLGSDFRVHGTTGLRVVDASVFSKIPGVFIVSAIYMIGEKAADVILASA